jgi:hypothetical protein
LIAACALFAPALRAQGRCDETCTSTTPCTTECWVCQGDYEDYCPENHTHYETCGDFTTACDACTGSWVLVADLGQCDWDRHETWLEYDVQKIGALRYHNTCNNNYCSKRYVIDEQSCTFSFWGCGQGAYDCCVCKFGSSICNASDSCGGPDCPF